MSTVNVGVYDDAPESYDAFQTQFLKHGSPLVTDAYRRMFQALELQRGQRILEVGIGTGLNLEHYPPGSTVVGVDRSESMLAVARRRLGEVAAEVELVHGDASALGAEDGSFDAAVCTFVLCSCTDPGALVREMLRVCRSGGRLALFDFHKAHANPGLLGDQALLRETFMRGIFFQGKPVAVCDTFFDLSDHLPASGVEIVYDRHLEGSIAEAFRATVVEKISLDTGGRR